MPKAQAQVFPCGTPQNSGRGIGPTNVPKQNQRGPSLAQQRIKFFEQQAAKMGGSVPKPRVQEARPSGQTKRQQQQPQQGGPHVGMQDEFASAESMHEVPNAQWDPYVPQSVQVLPPAAWRQHAPNMHEPQFAFASGFEDAQGPDALHAALPVQKAARLAEYALSSPAPAGSTILQLVSQSGLEIGDLLYVAPGTQQQELVQIVGFGSVILGVPLRHTHALGTQVVLAQAYATGTPAQASFMRGEAARHAPPRRHVLSHGGLTDDDDAGSLEGFKDDQAWSDAEREHQKSRHRRKNRQALRPRIRALPTPPVVSHTIRQPEKFHCPPLPQRGQIETFEEKLVAEFRSFTSLGESAEAYVRIVFTTARACTALESSPEWEQEFENLSCDQTAMVIARSGSAACRTCSLSNMPLVGILGPKLAESKAYRPHQRASSYSSS